MKKVLNRIASVVVALAILAGSYSSATAASGNIHEPSLAIRTLNLAAAQQSGFYERLIPGDTSGWGIETSGAMEKVITTPDSWICEAGGYDAFTHYARFKYKAPEQAGIVLTTFYMKLVVVLPADFYTQQTAGFRLMNTDNYTTTLNGVSVGAINENELRTSVFINSNHSLRVNVDHEGISNKILYISQAPLPVGQHTLELFGSLDIVAPWYLRVDGIVVASGREMLSTDDTAANERVATRFVAGIDGAADQDLNTMRVEIKSFEVANYDLAGVTTPPPTASPVPTLSQPTNTPTSVLPTTTFTAIPSPTLVQPTFTPTLVPATSTVTKTALPSPTQTYTPSPTKISSKTYDQTNGAFVYSSNTWQTISAQNAYNGSYRETTRDGSSVTFPFTGQSFSILYKAGITFSKFKVYVDGVLVGTLDQKASSTIYQKRWDYPGTLPYGSHTLKLVFQVTSSNVYRGSLDAIVVR